MKRRLHAALVIARRQAFETLLSPGLYVTLALGLLLGFFLVSGFAASIDSAGFNPTLNPLYDTLGRSLAGIFGSAFVGKLFAEGPFLFALVVSFLPVFLFLSISSVFRFGQEKTAGAVELLVYGPADGTSYIVASFLKDVAFTAASLALIAAFLGAAAALGNLVLGPLFLASLPVLFALALAISAYGIICSVLSGNASSALAVFLGILLVFLLVLAGSLSIASASVRTVASAAAAVLQWISPFFYASLCLRAVQGGSAAGVLGGIGLLLLLAAVLLAAAHLAISRRGVRA
jgi:hypothetical protein